MRHHHFHGCGFGFGGPPDGLMPASTSVPTPPMHAPEVTLTSPGVPGPVPVIPGVHHGLHHGMVCIPVTFFPCEKP